MEPERWDPVVPRVLSGTVRLADIPEIPQRVVRVFLSSTGVDSQTERNVLVENVYPKLREYCSQRYGVDFQMVDLEWGISKEEREIGIASSEFKSKELQKCHDVSVGPSFVAFIGQKYGDSPLPAIIPASEFENIRLALKSHKGRDTRSAPLLDQWYIRDDNSLLPVYVLKSVKERIPEFVDVSSDSSHLRSCIKKKDGIKRGNARTQWEEEEKEMKRLFQKGAELSYLEGLIDGDTKQKYFMSGQDMAVQHGTEESGSPKSRCVLITRTIVDLKNYVDDAKALDFTEITENDKTERLEMDETCASLLSQLKTRTKGLISNKNSLEYDVLWRYEDVIHPKLHAKYLNKLCNEFHDIMKQLIDETVPNTKFDIEPEIFEEVLHHWTCCQRKVVDFCGQEGFLNSIRTYISGKTEKPFVVYGPSGSGKSTILSKIATEICDRQNGRTICAIRYVGYTPKSSDIKQILMSISLQLLLTLGRKNIDIPYDFKDLQRFFNELLDSVPPSMNVVVFLDAVDKLIPEYNAHFMSWLPAKLKPNVKIVISTDPVKHNILDRLKKEIIKEDAFTLEMKAMSSEDAENLLQYSLGLYGRTVSKSQLSVLRNAFQLCSYPMYVHLLADKARTLTSADKVDDIPLNIKSAINNFFDTLENKHGKVLVSRALGYLVESVTGLSDCEIDDLLSLDDVVLNSVYQTYHPPVRRIPCIKWLLIKDDIEQFLYHRDADGVTVYLWCHDEFEEVVRERYLNDDEVVKSMHSMLADYFLGTWAGKKKPVMMADSGSQSMLPCGKEADRLVALQPLSFETPGGPVRFNKRKYDQVPRHLFLAGRLKELNSLVLFNYEWLYSKIKALSLTHIMADFVLNPGEEATLVEESLRVAETTIENNINNLAPEITGHLLPYYKTHPNIRALVRQCDTAGLKHCALIPNFPYLQVPGSSLQYTLTSPVVGEFFSFTNDDRNLLTKIRESSLVYQFDVATGEAKGSVFASNGDLYVTPNGHLFIIVDHVTEKAIKIHRSDSGAYIGQLIVMNHIQLRPKEKYKMGAVSITNDRMSVIVSTETSYLCIADIIGCQFLQIIGLDGRCNVCEVTPSGKYVFCNSNEFILCYDMYTLEHICTVSVGYVPNALAFTKDGFRAFLTNSQESKLLVMHVHRGAVEMAYKTLLDEHMPDDKVAALKVSPKDDMVLIRGKNHILVYNRFTEKVCARFTRPKEVPKEFKLPKRYYTDLFFTNADFSRDGNFVIGTIFRNIYLWQISTGYQITSIQAPVGIISELLVSKHRSQVITHMDGSKDIQVWNIDEAVNQVNMLDKLTGVITDIKLTADNSLAYVRSHDSDEIGVIDMRNGTMMDLLTHDMDVVDFAPTPDGHYVLVCTKGKKRNTAIKIWDMKGRKIIKEMGRTTGYCLGANVSQSILLVAQEELSFNAPYYITNFNFMADGFRESVHPLALKYVLRRPFLTNDDKHMVVLTAQDYIDSIGVYDTPTICAFSLENDMKVSYYTPESFQDAVNIHTINDLRPCQGNMNTIVVVYTSNAVTLDCNDNNENKFGIQLGLLILDISNGAINTICEPFMKPDVPIDSVVFAGVSFCIDGEYNVFDIARCKYVGQLKNPGVPPRLVALYGNVIIYYKDTRIYAASLPEGHVIADCEVHSKIRHLKLCSDERTILAGCEDGTIVSYVLIDPSLEAPEPILECIGSRVLDDSVNGRDSRSWDKVSCTSVPNYSRPPSGMSTGSRDSVLLKQIKPAPKIRPTSDTLLYLSTRSKTCSIQ